MKKNKCLVEGCKNFCNLSWGLVCDFHFAKFVQGRFRDSEVKILLDLEEARMSKKAEKILEKNKR